MGLRSDHESAPGAREESHDEDGTDRPIAHVESPGKAGDPSDTDPGRQS
jgi:hypothetical protein